MKAKELVKFLDGLDMEDEIYVGYDDYNELSFELFTEQDIIDRANNQAGIDVETCEEEGIEPIKDIDTALVYLADMDYTYHFML